MLDGTIATHAYNPFSEAEIVDRAIKRARRETFYRKPRSWSAYLRMLDTELKWALA